MDLPSWIDVEGTIAEFGYDPKTLTKGSRSKVISICICANCHLTRTICELEKKK